MSPLRAADAISYGWTTYWRNTRSFLVVTLVVFVANTLLSVAANRIDPLAPRIAFNVLGWLLTMLLSLGVIRASLEVTEGREPKVAKLLRPEGYGSYVVASLVFAAGLSLGLALLIVPGVVFGLTFHLYGFVIAESPTVRPIGALRRSAEITRGARVQLLGLWALLVLLNFAGLLAFGIGVFFTYGISAIALAYAYRLLTGRAAHPST